MAKPEKLSTIEIKFEANELQPYFDTFNREIEDRSNTLVSLTDSSENFISPREKSPTNENGIDDAIPVEDEDDEDDAGTYFVDESGNYFYQARKDSEAIPIDASNFVGDGEENSTRDKKKIVSVKSKNDKDDNDAEDEEDNISFVFLLDNNDEDGDNGQNEEKKVFEFDENEEMSVKTEEKEEVPKYMRIRKGLVKSNETHQCTHCEYVTTKRYLLARHMKCHSDDRPYKCSVCERGFKTAPSLQNHANTHTGTKPHSCKHCEATFTTSGELVRHNRYKHTYEKPHKCTECDYSSVEMSKLKRHIRCHTGERPYQCPHCTYASPDTFKLKRHLRTHTGEKPYECDICRARFTQSNSLKAHKLIHSVGNKPIFQCSVCPTTCGRKTDLRIHVQKLHTSDKPIICKRCGKSFPDRYNYKVHIKTHEGEKCFKCTFCPYASISQRHLDSHILIHTDQRPFDCDLCDQSFRQKQLLKRHMNLYHNKDYIPPKPKEKKHSCPHCSRAFSHKGNLMRHMSMHDPDSNVHQEKVQLRIGRKRRIKSNNDSMDGFEESEDYNDDDSRDYREEYVDEDDEDDDEDDAVYELEEQTTLNDNDTNIMHALLDGESVSTNASGSDLLKPITIKKEDSDKEFVAVEGMDGERYLVVEVLQCDDGDDVASENADKVLPKTESATTYTFSEFNGAGKITNQQVDMDMEKCFGFTEEQLNLNSFDENEDNKSTIQLMQIIE